jgi:WbqC-like protein family
MKVAICQPTYLPWMGYFDLIDQADVFVLLDDVQFKKRSWQQRNLIKTPTGLQWLTVPIVVGGRSGQLIKDVQIKDVEFWRDHCRSIELNYRRSDAFDSYFGPLVSHLKGTGPLLVDLNVPLIEWFIDLLGIKTRVIVSSTLRQTGKRTELLTNICRSLEATQYISPLGSAAYLLEEQDVMLDQGIDVVFHNFEHPEYRQLFPPFLPFASVIDLIFNEGDRAPEILRSGRRVPFIPAHAAARIGHVSAE